MDHFGWDDLRFARAVADAGTARRAGSLLRVSHQTVTRRIASLERQLGTKLFVRSAQGYRPTPAAEELVALTAEFEERLGDAARRARATAHAPRGAVRVALLEGLVPLLAPALAAFQRGYPEIVLELAGGDAVVSLARQEADVALRIAVNPPGDLVGRRLAAVGTAVYASREYLERTSAGIALGEHLWIGWSPPLDTHRPALWMRRHVPDAVIAARVSSFTMQLELVRAGIGVGILACYIADQQPDLVRVRDEPIDPGGLALWFLTHPDLRRSGRVRAFSDFICERLAADRALINGDRPQSV